MLDVFMKQLNSFKQALLDQKTDLSVEIGRSEFFLVSSVSV